MNAREEAALKLIDSGVTMKSPFSVSMLGNGILEAEIEIRHLKESRLSHKQRSLSFRFKLYGTHQVEVCWCNSPNWGDGARNGEARDKGL